MTKLFGTDGVRGVANQKLTPELAYALGRYGGYILLEGCLAKRPRVLVGRDTRISGQMLEAALTAGLASVGADVLQVGVIPTPGVAYLTKAWQVDAGVMISASHNPVADNGIKFFSKEGFKLHDDVEDEIETLLNGKARDGKLSLWSKDGLPRPTGKDVGTVKIRDDGIDAYVNFLKSTVGTDLSGLKIVVDCAHGAAYQVTPRVLRELGATVFSCCDQPNGLNINVACGSTHPESVAEVVKQYGADVGFAHDGDADRVIAIDDQGEIIDGDYIMVICGLHMLEEGRLAGNRIAVTVYSNLGVRAALKAAGGDVVVTANGDRYVLEAMQTQGLNLGGEQSGHIIFLDHNTTGDGVLSSLQLLSVMQKKGQPLSILAQQLKKYPQVLRNVPVAKKHGWEENESIQKAICIAEEHLGDNGRIFVRASGTEPLIRVMAEGPLGDVVEEAVAVVARAIEVELGR